MLQPFPIDRHLVPSTESAVRSGRCARTLAQLTSSCGEEEGRPVAPTVSANRWANVRPHTELVEPTAGRRGWRMHKSEAVLRAASHWTVPRYDRLACRPAVRPWLLGQPLDRSNPSFRQGKTRRTPRRQICPRIAQRTSAALCILATRELATVFSSVSAPAALVATGDYGNLISWELDPSLMGS